MPQFLSSDVRDLISLMLKKNPGERISVAKVLDHKWIKRGEIKPCPVNILPSTKDIDEEAFKCCQMIFPEMLEEQLRSKIKDFGYHTATYLLLKNNSEAQKVILNLKLKFY